MAEITLSLTPSITFDESDINRVISLFARAFKRDDSPLRDIDQDVVLQALANAIGFIINDRIKEGVGKYGWGYSDKAYTEHYYGSDATRDTHKESLMTTVVVVESLYKCLPKMSAMNAKIGDQCPARLLDSILSDLKVFLEPRWNSKHGFGGVLMDSRESDFVLAPRYRHTAWLMRLWMLLPQYRERVPRTAENLLNEFDEVQWNEEKVATDVAAYSAFCSMEENIDLCHNDIDSGKIKRCKQTLEDKIESKYLWGIQGWTAGNVAERERQTFTLFTLAEMTAMYKRGEDSLTQKMREALHATMQEPWCDSNEGRVLLEPTGQPSINSSCLAASAFLRKPSRSKQENTFLSAVMRDLIQSLTEAGPDQLEGIWSWALSYFVKDMADLLPAGTTR